MSGVLLQKLALLDEESTRSASGTPERADRKAERDRMSIIFTAAMLKLALHMYHPNERRRAGQLRYRRLLLQAGASDLKSRYIYKQQNSSDSLDVPGGETDGPKSPTRSTRSTRSRRSNSSSRPEAAPAAGGTSTSHSRRSRSRTRSPSPSPSKLGGSPAALTVSGGAPKKRRPSGGSLLESPTSSSSSSSIPPLPPSPGGSFMSGGHESATTSWLRAHLPKTYGLFERFSPVDERDNWLAGSRRASSMSDLDRELGRGAGLVESQMSALSDSEQEDDEEYEEDEEYGDEETDLGDDLTYHLDELIGQGAMGMVYRGTIKPPSPAHEVTIAVKHLHLPSANPHLNRKNFGKLIMAMSLADHPNVLTYFGSHIFDEDCFLFMEYCDGGTLSDWIKCNGPLHDLDRLRCWIRQLLSALDFLASHGIVHRDVKPANIMLVRDTLKITDFSSSKIHGMCCRKIHDARVVGTPSYMAPEIVSGNQSMEIRGAQDIWSLGCVIYEMLLAKPPFTEVDNVWSLYFILGNYARINIPPTPPQSRLRRLLDFISSYGARDPSLMTSPPLASASLSTSTTACTPAVTVNGQQTASPPVSISGPVNLMVPNQGQTIEGGFGALLGNRQSMFGGPQYRYAARDAVVVESAPPEGLVTPLDELANPFNAPVGHVAPAASTAAVPPETTPAAPTTTAPPATEPADIPTARRASASAYPPSPTSPIPQAPTSQTSTSMPSPSPLVWSMTIPSSAATSANHSTAGTPVATAHPSPVHSVQRISTHMPAAVGGGPHATPPASSATSVSPPSSPSSPSSTHGYVMGTDAQGYLKYKFLEPLYPMIPNHHPLLSQLCQVGTVDPLCLDLVEKCLEWDPRRRATAAGLLGHPLIRET